MLTVTIANCVKFCIQTVRNIWQLIIWQQYRSYHDLDSGHWRNALTELQLDVWEPASGVCELKQDVWDSSSHWIKPLLSSIPNVTTSIHLKSDIMIQMALSYTHDQ